MEQLILPELKKPYKYIIDSSSLFSQNPNDTHRRDVNRSLWKHIDAFINEQKIVICSEILDEIIDKKIREHLRQLQCTVLNVDEQIQTKVILVVTKFPNLIKFNEKKPTGSSSGDAFLIATAMEFDLTVITEEKKMDPNKIPYICNDLGITNYNIDELCLAEGWYF